VVWLVQGSDRQHRRLVHRHAGKFLTSSAFHQKLL
jgi:hypothetical protein